MESFVGADGVQWLYDLSEVLGHGGFGTVYGGKGPSGEDVAVKRLDLTHPGAAPLAALMREVEVGKRIRDGGATTHLLPVFDFHGEPDALLLVMDRADRSLRDAMSAGVTDDERLQVMRDIAAGLVELAGIPALHRDLKPQNVLWHAGCWKLADFGIARDLNETTGTLTWAGVGTLSYMAPELFVPPCAASPKSDLYALGCIAFELWAGELPFRSPDTMELARMHRLEPVPVLPTSTNVTVRRLIVRLLEKEPAKRPPDARAVEEDLNRVVTGSVSTAGKRLQQLATTHIEERAVAAAQASAHRAWAEEELRKHDQVWADLKAIVQAGADLVSAALPGVEFVEKPNYLRVYGEEAFLSFSVWYDADVERSLAMFLSSGLTLSPRAKTHFAYGQVDGGNDREPDGPPLGNIVCEEEDGLLQWGLYRYRRNPVVGQPGHYTLGPPTRRHGFGRPRLFERDVFQFAFRDQGVIHVFQSAWVLLTPDVVVELFASALALPNDA